MDIAAIVDDDELVERIVHAFGEHDVVIELAAIMDADEADRPLGRGQVLRDDRISARAFGMQVGLMRSIVERMANLAMKVCRAWIGQCARFLFGRKCAADRRCQADINWRA